MVDVGCLMRCLGIVVWVFVLVIVLLVYFVFVNVRYLLVILC